jgi:hypothetical protein
MDMQKFEEKLLRMTKPEVNQLKHQDLLAKAITNAKDKSVVSWWWLVIPLYIISTLLMKSIYMPDTNLISNIKDLTTKQRFTVNLFFLILPIFFILINIYSIRKIYILLGSPKSISYLKTVWLNILIIFFSILILIIYLI